MPACMCVCVCVHACVCVCVHFHGCMCMSAGLGLCCMCCCSAAGICVLCVCMFFVSLLTLCDEEVENGNNGGVPTEHVVPAALHSLQSHTQPLPDLKCTLNAGPHVSISLKEATDKNTSNQLTNANLSSQFMF